MESKTQLIPNSALSHKVVLGLIEHSVSVSFPLDFLIPFVSPNHCAEVNKSHFVFLIH